MTDPLYWVRWHEEYERPDSSLSQRLTIVQSRIREVLDQSPQGALNVISMCAGQGRDIIDVVANHPRRADISGRLVDLDPQLVRDAQGRLKDRGLDRSFSVVQADAGLTSVYDGATPADLVLVVGVFGNIDARDIQRTIAALPALTRDGGSVIWTRHRRDPDLTPTVRRWFDECGFHERAFDSVPGRLFAVGTHQLHPTSRAPVRVGRLFHFHGDGSGAMF